jgi:hypothetical protein
MIREIGAVERRRPILIAIQEPEPRIRKRVLLEATLRSEPEDPEQAR